MKRLKTIFFVILIIFVSLLYAYHPEFNNSQNNIYPAYDFSKADSLHGFDMQKYIITLNIDSQNHFIQGNVEATVLAQEDMTHIQYELEALQVTQVLVNNQTASYTYQNGIIDIQTGNISSGETFSTQVFYQGNPQLSNDAYHLGMFFGNNYVMTLVDPSGCRWWWPAYDHPWDKALVDLHITIRDDWLVASNGIRESIVDNNDGTKTHNWVGYYPIATYLVVITAANYTEINQDYNGLPIQNFVSPSQYQNALETLSNLPYMIQVYSQEYGEYPFEKYGNAVSPISTYAAMEHQTMTTLGNFIITGNHQYETTIAHELSHHWFGDCLTPLTWKDVWLSESFATYSEAVYTHHWQGWQAAVNYVQNSFHNYYLNWAGSYGPHSVYDPSYNEYFTPPTYEKGASVLHMLRLKYGGELFFNILRTFFNTYKYGNVITQDFINICQDLTGDDLTQFFNQWIYNPGTPEVDYCYFVNYNTNSIKIFAKTRSNTSNQFFVDIPARITCDNSADSLLFSATPNQPQENTFSLSGNFASFEIDPNHWVLTRSYNNKSINTLNTLAGNNQITLVWDDFWNEISISGYNIYRSENGNDFTKINNEPLNQTSYIDYNLQNNQTYYYKVCAVTNGNFESEFTNISSATPIDFPLNQGILVIDETDDGSGAILHPTDEAVDQFYQSVINSDFTTYDYAIEGEPTINFLVNFSTIIWHDDDFSLSAIENNIEKLSAYVSGGGNLIISGWKTSQNIDQSFFNTFFDNPTILQLSQFIMNEASSEIYQNLILDTNKIPVSFNGTLPFVTLFYDTNYSVYSLSSENGSEYDGVSCAIKNDTDGGTVLFLGFPLFYFDQEDVTLFFDSILSELGENNQSNDIVESNNKIKVFPNPFYFANNKNINISFSVNLNKSQTSSLEIFNLKGEKVKTIYFNGKIGKNEITWDGLSNNSKFAGSGIYIAKTTDKKPVKFVLLR